MNGDPSTEQCPPAGASTPRIENVRLLARKRRYKEATLCLEALLAAGGCSKAEALDLQARMYAQQGMLLQAESCWRQAATEDPHNPLYGDAIARIREQTNAASRVWNLGLQAAQLLLFVALVCIGIGLWRETAQRHTQTQGQIEALHNRTEQSTSQVEEALSGIRGQMRGLASAEEEALSGIRGQMLGLASAEMVLKATEKGKEEMATMERRLLDRLTAQQNLLASNIVSNQNAIGERVHATAEQQRRLVTERWQETAAALGQMSNAVARIASSLTTHSVRWDAQERLIRDLGTKIEQIRLADSVHLELLTGISKSNKAALAEIRTALDRIAIILMWQDTDGMNGSEASGSDSSDNTVEINK